MAQAGGSAPSVSRPVVQALPSREALQLNAALAKLGRNPKDITALLDAGDAANAMGDFEAASGFFERARQISNSNPRALGGLAAAMVRKGDPVGAIPLFDQAEKAGADVAAISGDRGLAYDLVGEPQTAQLYYRAALAAGADDEVTRRLAVSQAIAGNSREVERTLLPLLRKEDKSAWRARAFSLAILGKTKNAIKITETLLPPGVAKGIAPYLEYMPRLTAAQQAAAANLGKFPRASEIGRDEPRIAAFRAQAPITATIASVEKPLVPSGAQLGSKPAAPKVATAPRLARAEPVQPEPVKRSTRKSRRVAPPEPKPSRTPGSAAEPMLVASAPAQSPAAIMEGATPSKGEGSAPEKRASLAAVAPAPKPSQVLTGNKPGSGSGAAKPESAVSVSGKPANSNATPAPGFDLASLPGAVPSTGQASAAAPTANATVQPAPSFASAFGNIGKPEVQATPVKGAVDLRKVEPARPKKPEPSKPAAKPNHPSRIWVQLGIGQNKSALAADWKRLGRKSPELFKGKSAYVSRMNRTNRMLTGPFPSSRSANSFIAELRKAGIDGPYVWSSPAGQVVDSL